MRAAALCLAAAGALAACGGGGDDATEVELLRATATASGPDIENRFQNDTGTTLSKVSASGIVASGDRVRVCATGTWRQTLRSPTSVRLTATVQSTSKTYDLAGVTGAANSIPFSVCAEYVSNTGGLPVKASATVTLSLRAMDNRANWPVDGYDATADLVATKLP